MNISGEVLLYLSVLFYVLGCATVIVGKKKMVNWLLGVRWWITMKNPEIWKAVNVRIGLLVVLHGVFMMATGLALPEVDLSLFLLTTLLPALAWTGYSLVYAYQLKNRMGK